MLRNSIVSLAALGALGSSLHAQRAPAKLDTVRVTSRAASSLATPTRSVEVLSRDDLARHAGRSLADVLAFALGADVQQRSPAQADLALRGSTFNQVVVLVDGVRVSDVQSGHYALDLALPTASIDRIEILRGTGSALYGSDAIGGVVNIVTRDDAGTADVRLRGGSFGGAGGGMDASGEVNGFRLRGAAEADRSDGHRAGTDYRVTQVRGSIERATPMGRVVLDAGQGLRRFGAADFYSPFPSDETTRSTTAAVRLVPTTESRLSLSGAVHTRRHSDLFTLKRNDPAFYQNEHLSWQTGGEATLRAALSPIVVAAVGGELLDARLRSARLGDHDELRRGVFGEVTVGRPRGATLDAGVRGDWSRAGGFFSPSLGIALPLSSVLQLRASGSRGFRAPTWTERYYVDPTNIADSTLAVERVWSDEVGARFTPTSRLVADVALFERHATSLIDWARPAGAAPTTPWHTMNFAGATYRGVEALVRLFDVAGVDWTARGSGLRFDATAAPGTVGKYALRPLTRSVGLAGTRAIGSDASITLNALNARRTGEKSYTQIDAQLAQRLGGLRYSLELLNLTNASYLDGSGKPVASRSAFLQVGWPAR